MATRRQTVNESGSDKTHRSCENDDTVGVETAPRGHESRGSQSRTHLAKTLTTGTLRSTDGYAGTPDPAHPNLLKAARQSTTAVMATVPHEQQSATQLYLLTMLTQEGAPEDREESWKQQFRSLQTVVPGVRNFRPGGQHETIRADHDV